MACTFYVLPARESLGQHFARFLHGIFPGIDWAKADPKDLADTLTSLAENRSDLFVVHRDELTEQDDLETALVQAFGADKGDLVVELGDTLGSETGQAKLWRVTQECEVDFDDEETWEADDEVVSVFEE